MKALEIRNIKQIYSDRIVLDIPALSLGKGSNVALVGPNGSGKTTLLEIFALLKNPDQGELFIYGQKVNFQNPEMHRNSVAFVAQEPYFFSWSLHRNILFALTSLDISGVERSMRIEKYLDLLGLRNLANRQPATFSSGEAKRAAIARALCRETEIILLDEPFTHIDSQSASVLEEVISGLREKNTVVFSTHELSRAYKLADEVVTLQDGKVFPWTPENMFRMTAVATSDGFELRSKTDIAVYYPGDLIDGSEYIVSLNAKEVLVSREKIESSARNSFRGTIRKIESMGPHSVLVTVECPGDFSIKATVTERALKEIGSGVGDEVWVHFKSTAIHVHGND